MIFAAGLGTRLKPLTDSMPKALVPLAGKPLLQWQVEKLRDAGITDIIVNVHHFPDMIIDTIRRNNGWGCNISISDERDMLLDTGGGLKKAVMEGPILACNVDILSNIDLRTLVSEHERTGVSQLVVSERKTQRYLCFDKRDSLCGWTNIATGELKGKDGRHLAFSGLQILNGEALRLLRQIQKDKFSLIDFYLHLCEQNHQSAITNYQSPITNHQSPIILKAYVPLDYRMMDVGKIDQIEEAERFAESL